MAWSGEVEICGKIEIYIVDDYKTPLTNYDYKILNPANAEEFSGQAYNGKIERKDILPGEYDLYLTERDEENKYSNVDIPENCIEKTVIKHDIDEKIKISLF